MEIVDREKLAPGMAAQRARLAEALRAGMPRRGWKVGINVPEVLASLGLRHPGVGWLDGSSVFQSGAVLVAPAGSRLHVEPEIAIRVERAVGSGEPAESARAAIGGVSAALELVDYAKPGGGLDEVVAHSMFHAATVLGPARALADAADLGSRWPEIEAGGATGPAPRGDLVPADLGELVAFVASFLAAFGERLEAGDIVLSGSFTDRALRLRRGEEACARFGALGEVRVRIDAHRDPVRTKVGLTDGPR
jgi:2-keto-4-pentenoate hydratase